jgi:hypothetical protein
MTGGSVDALVRRQSERIARASANALKALPDSWVVLHDVRWPGRPFATIDHIAIGPAGVFVIGSIRWSGRIQLAGNVLRHNGRRREREVLSVREAAAAVSRRLGHMPPTWMTPVLCIVGSDVDGWAGSVAVCHKANLVQTLIARPDVLAPDVVRSVVNDLRLQLQASVPMSPARPSSRVPRPLRMRSSLAASLAGLAALATLAVSPQIVTGVTHGLGSLFDTIDSGSMSPDDPEMSDRP